MSASHTLGPWKVVHENVAKGIDCFEVASVSHMRVILKGGGWPVKTGNPEDDARLIAASPTMLAALQKVLSEGVISDGFELLREQVSDAIAAATGAAA